MSVELPMLGFGAAGMGNLFEPVEALEAQATMSRALSAGIRYFDTAPFYGFGLSERRLGDALRGRSDCILSTKVGRLLRPSSWVAESRHGFASSMPFDPVYDYSYDGVMRSFEDSLQRLGLGRVDILLVHDIGEATHGAEADMHWRALLEGGYRALDELRSGGQVAAIGLGVNEAAACLRAMREGNYDLVLLAGRYTLLEQAPLDDLLPAAVASGVQVVAAGVFNSGILATGTGAEVVRYDYGAAPSAIVAKVDRIEAVCRRHDVALQAAALQFPGRHPAVVSTLAGAASVAQLDQILRWQTVVIPDAFWGELKEEGLLRPDAPVALRQHL